MQAAIPALRSNGGGALVAVTSAAVGRVAAKDMLSIAPKAAIEALVSGIALEEGRNGIRANCIRAGWMDTGLGTKIMDRYLTADQKNSVEKGIPLRRFGSAEDIAGIVAFLCSEQASYITGQKIAVDGGVTI